MVHLKQELNVIDYTGCIVVFCCYFAIVFMICATCVMNCCIEDTEDVSMLQKWRIGRKKPAQQHAD